PVHSIAVEVSFDEAAFATLGAVALHGVRSAEAKLGDQVAVIGLGLIGQLTVQLLKAAGCRVLGMDIDPLRASLARELGADAVASSASGFRDLCLEFSGGAGADCVLITAETSSSDPVNLAGAIARDRAIVVAVGTVGLDIERKAYYEQKGRDYPIGYVRWTETRNMESFLQLVADAKVNVGPLITHRFGIEDAQRAYELIAGKSRESFLGVVLQYEAGEDLQTLTLVKTAAGGIQTASSGRVSVGLLGSGLFATSTLVPALKASANTTLVSVCAATGSHAQHAAQKFGFRVCTTDESQLINDSAINAVVIATR